MDLQLKTSFEIQGQEKAFYLVASPKGLKGVFNKKQSVPMADSPKIIDQKSTDQQGLIFKNAIRQLKEYFKGSRTEFDLPLDLEGTDFQLKVWQALRKIPYGKTISYKELAKNVRSEKAFRAVGNANGKNPVCIIIPCHRVIAADGKIGGYSGGLNLKQNLLILEKSWNLSN